MNFYEKYLKYKSKYKYLKMMGGMVDDEIDTEIIQITVNLLKIS